MKERPEATSKRREGGKGFILHVLPLLLYCTLLFFVSGMSQPPAPDLGFDWQDKVQHAGAFFIMGLLAYRAAAWLFPRCGHGAHLLIAFCFASLYGATDEIHQYFVPERSSDILDWVADTVGALLAILTVTLRRKNSAPVTQRTR